MSLKELSLQPEYRSDGANLITDFYTPCLKNATQYWRSVGYFTSNSLERNMRGLTAFIRRKGKIRLVTSCRLMTDDIEAIQQGYDIKEQGDSISLGLKFEDVRYNRLALLTWLIALGHLDIKIAYPSYTDTFKAYAMYHEKTGVFLDDTGNAVAFIGSQNETVGGLLGNFESFDVYWSWSESQNRVETKIDNFKRLWNNGTEGLKIVDFRTAAANDILVRQTVYETGSDSQPPNIPEISERAADYLPNELALREYQWEAIDAWFENDCRGLWEMATGTGKTITALSALAKLKDKEGRLFVIIVCPYQHLVDQWAQVAVQFNLDPILAYKSSAVWVEKLNTAMMFYSWKHCDTVCVITTQKTFIADTMQKMISKLKHRAVLVVDEAHHSGSEQSRKRLTDQFYYRLGLSATPDRSFDDEGTEALKAYFGGTVYEFSLKEAIEQEYLCPYYYYPHLVELSEEEMEEYESLTERIARLYHSIKSDVPNEHLKHLLIQRAKLLNNAEAKLPMLTEMLTGKTDSLHHALFYCAPGQIDSVMSVLKDLDLRIAKFTAEESTDERIRLLDMFASGHLQALVAMKCLDEGVDVPSTRTAYILASSSNPKEFIQRRGRILRKAAGKEHAEIHDLIAVPPATYQEFPGDSFATERKIVEKELKRFNEFAGIARNKYEALVEMKEFASIYNLLGLLGEF